MTTARKYSLVNDPLFYGVAVFFALLTTALPAALGQRWLLPVGQSVALWFFCFASWRKGSALHAARVLALWLCVQFIVFFAVALFTGGDRAIADGFGYRQQLLEWLFGVGALPASWTTEPVRRAIETLAVTAGTTLSAGILGVWFLVQGVNLLAFSAATLFSATNSIWGLIAGLQPWMLLRIIASVATVATFALPGYRGAWTPSAWMPGERRLFWWSLGLLAAATLLELVLPGIWAQWTSARIDA